jgi:hypothetical protein
MNMKKISVLIVLAFAIIALSIIVFKHISVPQSNGTNTTVERLQEELSSDTSIKSVIVNNVVATATDTNIYSVDLPVGTDLASLSSKDIRVSSTDNKAAIGNASTSNGGATWTVVVTAQDGKSTTTYTISVGVQISVTQTQKPTINKPIADDNMVNSSEQSAVVVSGTAAAGSTVNITAGNVDVSVQETVKADSSGKYAVTLDLSILPEGTVTIKVTATAFGQTESKAADASITKDTTAPVITIGKYSTAATNQDITVTAGVTGGTLAAKSHTFTANRSYDFTATDAAGNETKQTVTITNIDKAAPATPTLAASTRAATNQDVAVTITYSEDSTVKEYKIGNGDWTAYTTPVVVNSNAVVEARAADPLGNVSGIGSLSVNNIDKARPKITIGEYSTAPTNQDVTVTASTNEGTLNAASHTFTANGSYDFAATDAAGNITTKTVTITNIDKAAPVITLEGASTVTVAVNGSYTEAGATATDNYDNNLQAAVTGTVDTTVVGSYTVFYNVTDSSGNAAVTITRTVNVVIPVTKITVTITPGSGVLIRDVWMVYNNTKMIAAVSPTNATIQNVIWSITPETGVAIDSSGVLTGNPDTVTVTVTATAADGFGAAGKVKVRIISTGK